MAAEAAEIARHNQTLRSGSGAEKEAAALALLDISVRSEQSRSAICEAGSLPLLVELLNSGSDRAKGPATGVLRSLAWTCNREEVRAAVHMSLPSLVGLLRSSSIEAKQHAAAALGNLAAGSEPRRTAIHEAGSVPLLVALLRTDSDESKRMSAWALGLLALNQQAKAAIQIQGPEVIPAIQHGLRDLIRSTNEEMVKKEAQDALRRLIEDAGAAGVAPAPATDADGHAAAALPAVLPSDGAGSLTMDRMEIGFSTSDVDETSLPLLSQFLYDLDKPTPSFMDSMTPITAAGLFPLMDRMARLVYDRARRAKERGSLRGDQLSIDCIAALMMYTADQPKVYGDMNNRCYKKDRSQVVPYKEYIRLVLAALKALPPYGGKQVFRGVKLDLREEYTNKQGDTVIWHGFSSTTKTMSALSSPEFCGTTGPRTIFTIELSQNQAREITRYSVLANEDEVLIPPGSTFLVRAVLPQGELTLVQLEEVMSEEWIVDLNA